MPSWDSLTDTVASLLRGAMPSMARMYSSVAASD